MSDKILYFDNAATTKLDEKVYKEMVPYLTKNYGNPSSLYSIGRQGKQAIDASRKKVADVLNCKPREIYFTSGGSESDNLAIKGIMYANRKKGNHIITSKIEHSAVLNTCKRLQEQGFAVTYVDVDKNGKVILDELKSAITKDTVLISIMFANNEIGTIQEIESIGNIAKQNGVYFHTDAVQAVGNIRIDVQKLNIDALSMSAHKFYGPKGVGALYIRSGIMFDNVIDGGHQEMGKRAGTENVASIVGLGKAIEMIYQDFDKYNLHLKSLRDRYIQSVESKIPSSVLNGDRVDRLPGNANFSFKDVDGETVVLMLDNKNICVSSGSACNSGISKPSNVLVAIGQEKELLNGAVRVSFGKDNTIQDVDYLVNSLVNVIEAVRQKN